MSVHNHPPYRPMCPERRTPDGLKGACLPDETTSDQATIRASWDEDEVTRIVHRVGAALNSGRDAAVVDVVLDEVEKASVDAETFEADRDARMAEVEMLREGNRVACARFEIAERRVTELTDELALTRDTLRRRTDSHAALIATRLACPTCSTLPTDQEPA